MTKATPAAIALLRQATALRPKRKKASDGLLPSAAHLKQNPNSDHNTGYAADVTHDPLHGINGADVFEKLQADKRVKYLIFKGRIWTKEDGNHAYTGSNPHNNHIHISIKDGHGNDTSPWYPWLNKPVSKSISAARAAAKGLGGWPRKAVLMCTPLPKKKENK